MRTVFTCIVGGFGVLACCSGVAAYESITVQDGAVIQGTITFQGPVPAPQTFLITKDPEVCGQGHMTRQDIQVSNGVLQDVVVALHRVERGKAWPAQHGGYKLDQKGCAFYPYLQVLPRGAALSITNSDAALHNLHALELIGRSHRTMFNLAQPHQGAKAVKTITPRRGEIIRLKCDAHNWMVGWLYVLEHPYYAVVGPDGRFRIADIPPGTYTVRAWHPFLGIQERELTLGPHASAQLVFTFSAQ